MDRSGKSKGSAAAALAEGHVSACPGTQGSASLHSVRPGADKLDRIDGIQKSVRL
jgi:hypothetical protein